jgi:drug/metabolite transporter (DMT)-like permease
MWMPIAVTVISQTTNAPGQRLLWPALAAALVISWSSGFVGIRYASEQASVMQVLFWRTLVSGALLFPFALLRGPRLTMRIVGMQVGFGVMAVFLYLGGFALAIGQRVPTGLVALISDLVPLAIAALSHVLLGERMAARQWTGTAIAITGVVLVSFDSIGLGTAPMWAYGLTVGSMGVFALSTVLQKRYRALDVPIHQSLCIQFLTGSVLFGVCAFLQGDLLPPVDQGFVLGVAWLVLIATFLCYTVYYTSLRLFSAAKVSAAIYLSPPVTMVWAWALFSEPLSVRMFIGLGITLIGVYLTSRDAPHTPA